MWHDFVQAGDLKKHTRIHTGDEPLQMQLVWKCT